VSCKGNGNGIWRRCLVMWGHIAESTLPTTCCHNRERACAIFLHINEREWIFNTSNVLKCQRVEFVHYQALQGTVSPRSPKNGAFSGRLQPSHKAFGNKVTWSDNQTIIQFVKKRSVTKRGERGRLLGDFFSIQHILILRGLTGFQLVRVRLSTSHRQRDEKFVGVAATINIPTWHLR
jgi:hypothetical protein